MEIQVFGTPAMAQPGDLLGGTVVVIDALRMTSVAAAALLNGCAGILASADVPEARLLAERHGALLGGERESVRIDGFDFSNSPGEYTAERISGRRLVMTTTNGTQAILAARDAERVLLGAFVNADAVAAKVCGTGRVSFLCAGTHGRFSTEDALAAGAIIARLRANGASLHGSDLSAVCETLYAAARDDLHSFLGKAASHYARLSGLGLSDDLTFCLTEDSIDAVPERRADGWFA